MKTILLLIWLAQDSEHEVVRRREEARGAFRTTGQGLYLHYCAHCHGEDRKGGGRLWTTELTPKPADLTATERDEAGLVKFLSAGSGLCPPWSRTPAPDEIGRLARHVSGKSPSPPAANAAPAEPPRQPFPWTLVGVIAVELAVLGLLFARSKKGVPHAVPENPAVRG